MVERIDEVLVHKANKVALDTINDQLRHLASIQMLEENVSQDMVRHR